MTDPFSAPSSDPSRETVAIPPVYNAPPPYGSPPPGRPPYGDPVQGQARNGLGIAALILGILSIITIFGGLLLGIPGLIFGILGRKRAKRGGATNGGVALAGIITSTLGVVLFAGYVMLLLNSATGQRFLDCLDAAGNNKAANQQCSDQLVRDLGFNPTTSR